MVRIRTIQINGTSELEGNLLFQHECRIVDVHTRRSHAHDPHRSHRMAQVQPSETIGKNAQLLRHHMISVAFLEEIDTEVTRQPVPVGVIKTEMASQEFRVRVELIEIHKVSERYPHIGSKTSMSDFHTTLESDS